MKTFGVLLAFVLSVAAVSAVSADDGDSARSTASALPIGEQTTLVLEVATDEGAQVEVDPAAASWNGVEVVRLGRVTTSSSGGRTLHRLELTVAPFQPGPVRFQPAINVVLDGTVEPRLLPAVTWTVLETLPPDAPLVLSPLPPPLGIEGAQSQLLWPAIGLGVAAVVALLAVGGMFGFRWWSRRLRPMPLPEAPRFVPGEVPVTVDMLDADPVGAYRTMAASVRLHLGRHYGLPAHALTTRELHRRMESGGIDRWQARLVDGLLEECDAVVYAGYRPAAERRRADLTMAVEIVEAVS